MERRGWMKSGKASSAAGATLADLLAQGLGLCHVLGIVQDAGALLVALKPCVRLRGLAAFMRKHDELKQGVEGGGLVLGVRGDLQPLQQIGLSLCKLAHGVVVLRDVVEHAAQGQRAQACGLDALARRAEQGQIRLERLRVIPAFVLDVA